MCYTIQLDILVILWWSTEQVAADLARTAASNLYIFKIYQVIFSSHKIMVSTCIVSPLDPYLWSSNNLDLCQSFHLPLVLPGERGAEQKNRSFFYIKKKFTSKSCMRT